MPVHLVNIDFQLSDDRLLDLFIIQWHTPVPIDGGNWKSIGAQDSAQKIKFLEEFKCWLLDYFEMKTPKRPVAILAPELSMPISAESPLDELMSSLHRPALLLVGYEFLKWNDYCQLVTRLADMPRPSAWTQGGSDGQVVNCAGIWIRENVGTIRKLVQPKTHPSDHECPIACPGENVLVFRSTDQTPGPRLNFCVQICSDFCSTDFVKTFRRTCSVEAPELILDITFLLQCNENQSAVQFKEGVKAYFEVPDKMVTTAEGCVLFVNNANSELGKSARFGQSKANFRFEKKWRDLALPSASFWLSDEPAFDHQAVVLRELGPSLYWLTYKPRYLVSSVAGSGQPQAFPQALWAPLRGASFGDGSYAERFEPIPPIYHWLKGEWQEGAEEFDKQLKENSIPVDVNRCCVESYRHGSAEWLTILKGNDQVSRNAVSLYFECCQDKHYPATEAEPQRWGSDVSKATKELMRTYALLRLGAESLPNRSVRPVVLGTSHASDGAQLRIVMIWGRGDHFPLMMTSTYLSARETRLGDMLTSS